jgi:hypothetical protein
MTSVISFHLMKNQLTSVPVALGGLGAMKELYLGGNHQLTSVPAVFGIGSLFLTNSN